MVAGERDATQHETPEKGEPRRHQRETRREDTEAAERETRRGDTEAREQGERESRPLHDYKS